MKRKMKIKSAEFLISAVSKDQYPIGDFPDVAFVGRSNVGKSSLINMLVNRKSLARTSSTPGQTQTINFYRINEEFNLVDLPGYGYARVSKTERGSWKRIIDSYLTSRDNLVEIIQIVDIRHNPTEQDKQMYQWLKHNGFGRIVVANKLDKISRGQRKKQLDMIRKELNMGEKDVLIPVSSVSREGKEILWCEISKSLKEKGYDITG